MQDSAKSADEVLNSLIKYAKGQGEKGVNNLQKIKDYLGEENNAFLEMQILNKLFKESVVENDRASLRVFDSESFLGRVRELVGENELYAKNELDGLSSGKLKEILQSWDLSKENNANKKLRQIVSKLGNEEAKELSKHFNFKGKKPLVREIDSHQILHALNRHGDEETELKRGQKALTLEDISEYENIVKNYDFKHIQDNGRIIYAKQVNGHHIVLEEVLSGQDKLRFFDMWKQKGQLNKEVLLSHSQRPNANLDQMTKRRMPSSDESITQPLFKSKEAREFLELVEGFHKLYKNDASIAKNLVQGTSEKLSTSIATSAEGAIKQKVVKGGFDPIFRLLPDGILFGLFSKQIQGGALRYHLKKALSRSLNYDDFKIKLEKELKRTNFNSNTSRLIDDFMQNLEDFNREKEQFLEAKRIEQARIKEEEQARINAIKTAQENAYNAQEANLGKDILESSSLKEDFGENFAGYKGKEAIEKLLEEKRGQVKGAFYKEGLGEIDLVWGDENFGLRHILNKHGGEFKNLAKELSEAVENGKIVKDDKGRLRLEYENKIVGIKDNWKGEKTAHWVVTAYVKKEKEASLYTSASFTKGETLPLNSKESIAQKALNLHEKLYLKDNDTPLNVEYKIVNKDDIKPTFTLSKTQFRSQKQEDLIKKIKENFNPDLLVNIRGDLKKGNPIITKQGEVISGNHRAAALKELEGENLAKYQNAVKEAFGVELKENEMLVRVADTSEAEIRRFSAASNEGLENNLGEQGVSLFAKYQDKIKALKEAKKPFVADDVYNLKYLVNKALGESSITKENDTSKALFASLARGRNNTILKALNELEKENLEQVSKVANMFFDNAGAFYNLTHDLDLPKMQNLQNYFSDVLVSAAKADFTRAEDFARLNEDIRAFLDSGDKNAMLKLNPNLVSDLLAKAMGAGFARFARLENPSASLYEFLNGLKAELIEKGAPDLFSGGKGIKLNERDEFDFAKELILKGQDSEEKFRLYQNLEELKAWSGEQKNTKLNTALKALDEVDESKLSEDQKELLRLFKGEIKSVKIQIKDLKDIYTLNQGSRKEGAKKILIKHYGEEKTGGLSSDELLSLKEVIKKGKINLNSLEIKDDFLRYGYDYEKDGVKLRVVIDEFKDGKKVFDYYSDRNFNHYEQGGYKPDLPTPSEIIPQNAKTSPYPQNADEAVRLETISKQELEQSNPQQSHLSTDESIAQNSEKLPFETQTLDEDKLSGDEVRLLANKIGEKSTMAYFKDYLLKMDKNFHARAKDIIREYYKIEPFRKELENQWENVKAAYKNGEMSLKEFKFLSRYKDEKSFLNQVAGVLWLQNDELVKKRGYTYNEYGEIEEGRGANYYNNLALEYGKAQTALKKWFYYIQKANKQAQRFFNKKELEDLRANEKGTKLETKGSEDIIFTDKKGKEHTLTKETQKAWLEAFGLKSLEDSYIPNHNEAIKQALEGKEIKLQLGSLKKLVAQGREKYIPQIKEVLDRPEAIMRDDMGEYLFIKHLKDDDYFVNVSFDNGEYLVSISNGIKETRNLNNKLKKGGEFIYQSPNFNFISQKLLQTSQYSANKIDEDIIAQNAKSERAEFESFKDKMKELYTKYEGLNPYDKSESQLRIKLLDEEIEPEIKKEFKNIIDKFKGADNKDKMLRVIKENKEELSDYLAFNIALRKDIDIDGHGEGKVDFYDKSIRDFIKFRENKQWSEIDESKYRALAALENLSNKNTSLYFSFKDLNGKVGEIKTYPRIQDLLFYDLILGYDLKNAVILSTKDKHLKEKLIEKLKAYIDKKIYADFLEYKIKDLESRNPKNSHFENYKDEKWDEEALKSLQKELEDLRANEKAQKLEAKGSEDIIFTDKKGKEHTLTKETQKAWLEAFNLKSLEEAYIPNFKAEVKEAINRVLGGEEIKLTKGSLIKLIKEKRLKYLDRIKPTLENPHSVILQNDGALIFARDYGEEKYFTSVARNDNGEWIIRSNAPKSKNGLNNKILNGGKEIYNDQAASQINASNPYDDIANSNIKLDNESIAQNSHYLELVKEYGEENAKSIIKQKILSENIAQVLENEEEKFIYKKGDREFEFKIKDAMGQFEMQYDELNLKSDLNKSFLKALNKLKIGYEVLENEPVRIRYFKQEAKERKPKETKPSANKTLGQIQKDMSARLKELKAQAKENYERYKNEDKALQKELTNTKDLFKAFEKEFNETEGTILISRAKRRKNDAEGKVETSVFLGNELALRNALDRWERYSGYSEENALEVKERLELLRSYVKRLEKHREDIKAKREQLEQDYQQNEAARSKEMGVIGNYNILSNLKGVSENELYEPFLEKIHGFLSKADFYERHLPFAREEFQKLFNLTPLKEFGTNYAEFYRDGKGAVEKLLAEKQGQVAGAFYKEGLGEIDLVWGEAGSGKSDGFGLAKIVKYHPEVIDKLDDIIANTSIVKESDNRYHLENENYKLAIRKDFEGEKTNWLLTAFEKKDSIARRRTDLPSTQSEAEKTTSANANEIIPQEIEQAEIKKLLEEYGEQISSNYPQETARLILEQNKNDGIVLSGFKIKGKSYDPEIEAMQFKTKKAEREFESLMESYDIKGDFLNFKEAYSFKPNDEAFLQYLAKYEGDENAKLALAYNLAKQLVMRRGGGRAEVYTTDFLRQMHILENQNSTTLHSNPHLGAGLVGGVLNGVEQDENGNLSFDPVKFAMGFLGGAAGSKAVKESIKWRANKVKKAYPNIAKNNPALMEQIAKRDLLTYAKNETQNALTRLLNKNKLFDSTKGLFAGEKALLNEAYAPHKARLEKAKELEGSGADEIEIWEKTGWYKDKDHKWKFEISQRGGELDLAKIKDKDSEAKLGEILKDDELFKAYPQLRDMSVKHVDLSGNYGFYYVPYNDIKLVRPHIQLDIDEIKTSPYKVKEVLYHEIQHAIQHKEQFAYGLSYMAETYERYLKQHGEVEARNIQERMKNPTKIHPHKTMDTDIEDTIAESALSTEYSEAFSRKLEKSFLDESGRIAYKSLMQNAEKLPKELNLRGFKQMIFNDDKTKQLNAENALIKTPVGEVKVNVLRAFNHYMKNGKNGNHKENRQALNATFMPTLLEPKFVTRDEEGTMYYYKPFISKDKEYHITSIAVKKNGNLDYATSYNATENRLRQMIKHNELVYEKD
ncbi:PBECR2 nuclease fold domain-containing protein [Campylobacter upsaliensis]